MPVSEYFGNRMTTLTVREDDIGRWRPFRPIVIGLRLHKSLARCWKLENARNMSTPQKKGRYLGMTPVFSFATCAGGSATVYPAFIAFIARMIFVITGSKWRYQLFKTHTTRLRYLSLQYLDQSKLDGCEKIPNRNKHSFDDY